MAIIYSKRLYQELVQSCGASYYTPFFIRSAKGHGDYWLIHLSQHHRARDVMTQVHWDENKYFIHYGKAGLDMFGYDPEKDSSYTGQIEIDNFCFNSNAEEKSIKSLVNEIPNLVYASRNGLSFENLFKKTCNNSPASSLIYKEAIGELIQHKDIEVLSKDGKKRKTSNTIKDEDQIVPLPKQYSWIKD